jgi:small-conductance mechanosensitive channel
MPESVNAFLDREFLGNTVAAWLWAALMAGAVFTIAWVARRILLNRARAFASRKATGVAEMLPRLVLRTSVLVVFVVALVVGTLRLTLPPTAERFVQVLVVVMVAIQAALYGAVLVDFAVAEFVRRNKSGNDATDASLATTMGAVRFLGLVILYAAVVLLALDNLNIDVTAMIAGLGVGGIAVALAVQNILGDLFGSLSIVLDKPFVVGDFIIVGDKMGTVEKIGLKTTRVRALGGEQLIFSNSDLLASRIQNYKRMNERRIVFAFGVEYGTTPEQLEKIPAIVKDAILHQDRTRFDRAHFKAFGASSLDFEAVYFMLVPDFNAYMDVQQGINLELFRRLRDEGVSFAFPTQTLHVASAAVLRTEVTHDDRERGRIASNGHAP